jgi:dTMP kinase
MAQTSGKLFVIDGLDGSGKSTQFELLQKDLELKSIKYKAISFPDYEQPSSSLVKMYLNGDFSSSPDGVNAYAASSFYAVDRYSSYKLFWEENYKNGDFILASRYTTSNAIHQMVKLDESEWDNYLQWMEDYEYNKLMLPKPDCVVFLDMPVEVSQKLLSKRYNGDNNKKDIHESDVEYLKNCRNAALYSAKKLGWVVIECSRNGEPLSIEQIHNKLLEYINI